MKSTRWALVLMFLLLAVNSSSGDILQENPLADRGTRQLILIGVDGLQVAQFERLLAKKALPNFSRLMGQKGSDATATITGHKIPITAPGNAELLSGLGGSITGIVDNTGNKTIPFGKTIFERLKSFDPSIQLGSIYGKGTNYIPEALLKNAKPTINWWQTRTTYPQRNYINDKCADAQDVAEKSLEFIADGRLKSFFLLIYFGNPDIAGHKYGEPSLKYDQALVNVDKGLGILLDGLLKNNMNPKILLTADHGWNEGSHEHSKPDKNTMTIPLLTNDSGLLGNIIPAERRKQCDIAPTILEYFGLESTRYSDIYENGCSSFMSPQ